MRRLGVLVVLAVMVLSALPSAAGARSPGLARVEGIGDVDVLANPRAQVFGEVEGGRVVWAGPGAAPRVVSCADGAPLRRCATKRRIRGTRSWEWTLKKPARIFVLGRNYRLFVDDATHVSLSVTGSASLAVEGTGTLALGGAEPILYDAYTIVQVAPTKRVVPSAVP
jgi:hypothetical protein